MTLNQNEQERVPTQDRKEQSGGDFSEYDLNISAKESVESEIEKNLIIKTMPRKFKVSTPSPAASKNKAVGVLIMVVGVLIMGVAAYLVYAFLINPKNQASSGGNNLLSPKKENTADNKNNTPQVKKEEVPSVPVKQETAKSSSTKTDINSPTVEEGVEPVVVEPVVTSVPSTTSATSTKEQSTSTTPIVVAKKAVDTDKDGLSDKEEAVLGSNPAVADSDGDGFSDYAELGNLYDPAGAGKLSDSKKLSLYKSTSYGYSTLRPAAWREQQVGDSIIFSSPDNSFVQIIAEPNTGNKEVLVWYNEQFSESRASLSDVVIKNGWEGLYHKDGQIFYLTDIKNRKTVYTISYVPSEDGSDEYYNIFKLIINSFSLGQK